MGAPFAPRDIGRAGLACRYGQAHAAHYADDDLLGALNGYGEVIASHPDSPEAGYPRTRILAIVNRVVSADELLASNTALALSRLQPEGDRSAPVGP